MNTKKIVIQSIMVFNCFDKSPPSPELQKAISAEALFKMDDEDMLFRELEQLGFAPRKIDVQLVNRNVEELNCHYYKEAFMVDDPYVGQVILYLMKDEVRIH